MKHYIIGYWNNIAGHQEKMIVDAKNFKSAYRIGKETVKRLKSHGCESRLMCVCEIVTLKEIK